MSVSNIIELILSEWAYRVNDGMPNPKNPTHLKELGIVLSEMGLSSIKNELVENLLTEKGKTPEEPVSEEEKKFKNPILNKEIPYKSKDGSEKKGIVGNLLRLPKDHPGRVAAERMLPPEGSEDRDAINKDLGGEGQPTKPEDTKDGESGKGEEQPKEDPIKQAAAMFDPKTDPAMGARLDKERETLANLSGKETDDNSQQPAEKDTESEQKFEPIPAVDVNQEMPQADPETFGATSDIPDGVEPDQLEQFNTDIRKVGQIVSKAKENGQPIPDINLCQITIPGTNLYCDDNLGIPRDEMPQFKGKAVPGSRAADMPADESGEVDTEPVFRKMLEEKGVKVLQTEVPADKLKATQKDLVGAKVVGMMGALEKDPQHEKITAPIYVSRDGYVIDGHHRWAAIVAYNAQHPDEQIQMKTTVIDMDIKDAIPMCNKFAEDMGIAAKKADANKETPTEQPKKEQKEIVDSLKNRKTAKGESLDVETTPNGSMIIGVEHGDNNESTKETINQIQSLPSDTKVMFVGEGGMSKDSEGNLELSGEQAEIRDAVRNHFKNSNESSWDENANVLDDNSPVFDEVAKSIGGSKSKAKAAIWANMYGQDGPDENMQPDDYLDDEGKAWLIDQAKKGGSSEFDDDVDWNNLTDAQQEDLYQLNYRDDDEYGETEISKAQQAYNGFRQKELDRKIKEAEAEGYKVIAPVGNSHVDMWRQRNKGQQKTEMKEELFPMIDSLIESIINEFIEEAKPKQPEQSKKHPGWYHRGGGYYSKKPDGEITHKAQGNNLIALTPQEKKAKNAGKAAPAQKPVGKAVTKFRPTGEPKPASSPKPTKTTKPATKPTSTKKPSIASLSKKMEEDDLYMTKNKVATAVVASNAMIKQLPLSTNDQKVLSSLVEKLLKGEDLTKSEKKFIDGWVTFPATSEPKIYFTQTRGDFRTHLGIKLGKNAIVDREAYNEFLENNEVFDAGHPVKKKSMVASKLTEKRTVNKVENVKKDKDGKVASFSIGGTEFTRYPEVDENDLLKQFKAKGIQNPEEEVRKTVIAIRRHNNSLDFMSNQGEIEVIDFGADTSTSEGRKATIDSIKKLMYDKLNADFKKYYKGEIPGPAKTVLYAIKNLENPYVNPKGNAAEILQKNLDAIASMMNNNVDFRAGVPDMQEIFDFMVKLGQGYAGFMPSASNWKVTDIVTYKPTQSIKFKKGESPAEAIANNFQNIISTALIEGGLSVKYEKGGASAGYDKVMMTVYKQHKGFDTKNELIKLFDTYKWSFTPGEESRVKSKNEIDAKEAELNSVLDRAKKAGIINDAEIKAIQKEGVQQAARMAAKVDKKVPFKKYKQCFGSNEKEQKANYENYKRQCGMWCKMGAMAEIINNNDMDYQLFGNLRTVYPKKGEPKHEVIDGVTTLSGMGWSFDPGISATGKECKFLSLNNANSSHIEPVGRK